MAAVRSANFISISATQYIDIFDLMSTLLFLHSLLKMSVHFLNILNLQIALLNSFEDLNHPKLSVSFCRSYI